MTSDYETEIESCLAYTVMQSPDPWIGSPSTIYLKAFLLGASWRQDYVASQLPDWHIFGVLNDPTFYKPFIDATGHPTLTIGWATALAMTHHSLAEGFTELRDSALAWHRKNGVAKDQFDTQSPDNSVIEAPQVFWNRLATRPGMYCGDDSGWALYCFLNGMHKGGDWLGLSPMPELDNVFGSITARSERSYGSPFAAFRVCKAQGLLQWAGLPNSENVSWPSIVWEP